MLMKVKTLIGYKLRGLDGEMGSVKEFYFDDDLWMIRYLVAHTDDWLGGDYGLITFDALVAVHKREREIEVDLTRGLLNTGRFPHPAG